MKQFVNKLYDYEFTGEVKIEEIPTIVIDDDQDGVDKLKKKGKMSLNH